jgi:hypothetical protein
VRACVHRGESALVYMKVYVRNGARFSDFIEQSYNVTLSQSPPSNLHLMAAETFRSMSRQEAGQHKAFQAKPSIYFSSCLVLT